MKYSHIAAIITGNVLEFYDIMLFAHLSSIIGPLFFPSNDPLTSHLMALVVFALGYFARPIGAIYFGTISDKYGRKYAITKTVLLMTIPTFILAFLPTYAQIGIIAPILMIIARLCQGIALGGEYNNSGLILIESYKHHQCLLSGLLAGSCQIGSLIALSFSLLIIKHSEIEWLWRIPFFLGGIGGVICYKLRRLIKESPEFTQFQQSLNNKIDRGLINIFKPFDNFFTLMMVGGLVGTLVWIPITFTNFYISKILNLNNVMALKITIVAVTTFLIASIPAGYLADKIKPLNQMIIGSGVVIILAYPLFKLLVDQKFIAFQILFTLLTTTFNSPIHAFMAKLYQVKVRSRAVSLGFSLGISIFGSTSPLISSWLITITGSHYSPLLYIILIAIITLIMLIKTRGKVRQIS